MSLRAGMPTKSEARSVASRIQQDPCWFIDEVLGFTPWSKQREIIESVRDHPRTAVRSCHGSGKTATAARICLWYLAAYPHSRVITTAPTFTQVRDLLWSEIGAGARSAPQGLFPDPDLTRLQIEQDWFAVGISTDRPERFQGHHADRLLLVVDEASGVSEQIFEAAEGFLTGEHARVLLIGNPTISAGTFYRAFTADRALWNQISISALETPLLSGEPVPDGVAKSMVSPEWVEEKRAQWGVDSPMYAVRVLGEFPEQAENQVVSLSDIEEAVVRDPEPGDEVVVACDVARFGADETVIVVKRGNRISIERAYTGQDLMATCGAIADVVRGQGSYSSLRVVVDDAGLGGGVTDRLRELGFPVDPFLGSQAALDGEAYPNRRSEAWFAFADQLPYLSLERDDQLIADLVAPTYKLDSRGRRVVEDKDTTRKRLGRSPDRADAVLMSVAGGRPMGASFGSGDLYG